VSKRRWALQVWAACFLGGGLLCYLSAVSLAAVRSADELRT
jgi:hypothetical protein